jgi:hypothetical protein
MIVKLSEQEHSSIIMCLIFSCSVQWLTFLYKFQAKYKPPFDCNYVFILEYTVSYKRERF